MFTFSINHQPAYDQHTEHTYLFMLKKQKQNLIEIEGARGSIIFELLRIN